MNKRIVIALLLFIYTLSLYSYKLPQSFHFDTDFARDVSDILDISRGDIRLIGPKSSFGGLYSPSYYYYIFAPVFFITKNHIEGFLYLNAIFFAVALSLYFYLVSKRSPPFISILSSLTLILAPLFVFASRNPGNFTSYIPFLLILLTYVVYIKPRSNIHLFAVGFFAGIVMTFDYVAVFLLPFVCIYLFYIFRQYKKIFVFLLGFSIALSPLLLFEITHGFIMTKNTFIDGSYLSFLNNANLSGSTSLAKKNLIGRFIFIAQEIGRQNGFSFYLLLLITMISQVFHKKKDAASVICILAFMSFITLTFILKFQYAQHYVYPVSFFLLFSVVTLLQKRKQILLLCLILILQIIAFSKSPYSLSPRPYQKFEKVVKIIVQKKFITKNEKVNIIQVRPDTAIASSGHEYRYFFKEAGITLNPVFDYKSANSLLIFSEDPKFELKKLDNWEINEFGKNHKLEIAQIIDSILVLRLTK